MAVTLGLRMEEMIFSLADTHLFFNDLEVSHKTDTANTQFTLSSGAVFTKLYATKMSLKAGSLYEM